MGNRVEASVFNYSMAVLVDNQAVTMSMLASVLALLSGSASKNSEHPIGQVIAIAVERAEEMHSLAKNLRGLEEDGE